MIWELKKIFYRTYHAATKFAANILPFREPELLTGAGSVTQLAAKIKAGNSKHVLLVTDKVLMELKLLDSLLKTLDEQSIKYTIYDKVAPNPTIQAVEEGRDLYISADCDSILAFGGGSPIDCAKVIGARIANPFMSVKRLRGLFKVFLPIPPFFAVPTTAGTGSETTIAAVITDPSTHEKFAISDIKLTPNIAVLDPELMVGLPPHITAATGMDALTHAIEAYIGLCGSDLTDGYAKDATKLIFENLEEAYNNGTNINARENMALASFKAGGAFTRAYVGYVHAIAHNLGGMYGVPHGLANAIILPHILDYCCENAHAQTKLADLAVAGGLGTRDESQKELANKFIQKVKKLNTNMKIPTTIKELKKEDITLISERALKEAHPEYPVPKIMTSDECQTILGQLLASEP